MERIPPRAWIIPIASVLILIAVCVRAHAADQPAIDCKLIRALVKIETPEKLEREARAGGASEDQIRRAKACLK